jgi:hypothetical protein
VDVENAEIEEDLDQLEAQDLLAQEDREGRLDHLDLPVSNKINHTIYMNYSRGIIPRERQLKVKYNLPHLFVPQVQQDHNQPDLQI